MLDYAVGDKVRTDPIIADDTIYEVLAITPYTDGHGGASVLVRWTDPVGTVREVEMNDDELVPLA